MTKRSVVISLLGILLLATPVLAEMDWNNHAPPRTWLATEHDVKALNEKIAQTESTLNEKIARTESALTERIARTESTFTARLARTEAVLKETEQALREKVAALEREIKDLRAGAESKERHARQPQSDRRLKNGVTGKNGVNALTGRVAGIEKSLAGTVANIHDLRGRIQELRARAEAKERQARN